MDKAIDFLFQFVIIVGLTTAAIFVTGLFISTIKAVYKGVLKKDDD